LIQPTAPAVHRRRRCISTRRTAAASIQDSIWRFGQAAQKGKKVGQIEVADPSKSRSVSNRRSQWTPLAPDSYRMINREKLVCKPE
jgi:hypothetical protein